MQAEMGMAFIYVGFFLLCPAFFIWMSHRYAWAGKLGIIVLCYTGGLLLGNIGLVPPGAAEVQRTLSDVSVILALPLLLFTLDVRQWRHVAGKAMLSMLLASCSVVTLATALFFSFRDQGVESASHFAAMSVGVYTGGTPNLAAIKTGLEIPHSEYILFHSLDTLAGASYLLLMLTLGVPLFRRLLGQPTPATGPQSDHSAMAEADDYRDLLERSNHPQMLKSLVLSGVVVAISMGLAELQAALLSSEPSSATVIICATSLAIMLSLLSPVRRMHLAYKLGMYLIYVFSFVVATMASVSDLARVDASVAVFLFGTILGSLVLHAGLCRLARIDSDTFMVTSVAAVCSPPFVPMIARALNNPAAMLSGMTTGIIGYALGNYLGISLALFLQGL